MAEESKGVTLYKSERWLAMQPDWTRWLQMYNGRHEVMTNDHYLPKAYVEEKGEAYSLHLRKSRQARTRYLKLPEIIVSLLTSLFFRKPPTLDQKAKKLFEQHGAEQNIDGKGTSLYSFIKDQALRNLLLFGKPIILVDAFGTEVRSRKEELALGLRPYMQILDPLTVVDWSTEWKDTARIGKLNWLRYECMVEQPRSRATEKPKSLRISRELYRDGAYKIQVYRREDNSPTSSAPDEEGWIPDPAPIETDIPEIPVSLIDSETWIDGVCEETFRHHNLRSQRDNIMHQQCYQKIFAVGVNPTDQKQVQALSEYVISIIPAGGDVKFADPVDTAPWDRAIADSLSCVFKVGLNMLRSLPADSRESQSADAQDNEREWSKSLVESTLEEVEVLINDAAKNYALFAGEKNYNGKIELEKEISEENFDQWLAIYQAFEDKFSQVEVIEKEAVKKAMAKLRLPKDIMEEAMKAIDNTKFEKPEPALPGEEPDQEEGGEPAVP